MSHCVSLDEGAGQEVNAVGGKGRSLGALIHAGFPVPPGYVVTTKGYAMLARRAGIVDNDPPKAREHKLRHASWPSELAAEVFAAFDSLESRCPPGTQFVVRSSSNLEDLAQASFAGQHASFYAVERGNLLDTIQACMASLWSAHAFHYRTQQLDTVVDEAQMAVVVQRMIKAEVSGVTFTADPLTGNPERLVTHASWGMGAAIVNGRVTPDHFVLDRTKKELIEQHIGDKRFMVAPPHTGKAGETLVPVRHERRLEPTLNGLRHLEICELALRAEIIFGTEQDLEWALSDGQIWILQSRAVTTLGQTPDPEPAGKFVLFKPAIENFTEPMTPLTTDILGRLAKCLGGRLIDGWMYLDLAVLRYVVPLRLSDDELAKVAYLSEAPPQFRLAWLRLPGTLALGMLAILLGGVLHCRTRNLPHHALECFRKRVRATLDDSTLSPLQAAQRLYVGYRFFEPAGNMPLIVNVSAGRYFIFLALVRWLIHRWAPELEEGAAAILCAGATDISTVQMTTAVASLGQLARATAAVRSTLTDYPLGEARERLAKCPQATPFLDALARFLDHHGHRAIRELEVSAPRWHEDPGPVLAMVRNLLSQPDTTPPTAVRRTTLGTERALEVALGARRFESTLGIRGFILGRLIKGAQYFSTLRENTRYFHIMVVDVIRQKVLALAEQLVAEGKLRSPSDAFYLEVAELEALRGGTRVKEAAQQIRLRRALHARRMACGPKVNVGFGTHCSQPPDVSVGADILPGLLPNILPNILMGHPASPGRHRGRARVILDPGIDATLEPGEILVAPFTDPAWTPLFLSAGAVVVEVGSYLSHAGTVARELGLPSIVDVARCTSLIRTGDLIDLDAGRGEVRILTRAAGDPRVYP